MNSFQMMCELAKDPQPRQPHNMTYRAQAAQLIAKAQRDAGMAQALDHAEAEEPGWSNRALAALIAYANDGHPFTSYDFRDAVKDWLIAPTTDKAFGPVFLRAAKLGFIKKVGYQPHPERNCSPTVTWMAA